MLLWVVVMIDDCIYTTGVSVDKDGYPRVKHGRKLWRLNRLMYTLVHGEIPAGMVVGHICNHKGCINVRHLYLTTPEENSTHAARDGLYKTGFKNEYLKLAVNDKEIICKMYYEQGFTQKAIGELYSISQTRVSEIIRGATKAP